MRRLIILLVLGLALALPGAVLAQGASESFEREARSAFKGGRFRDAAAKFQDAAGSAVEASRRGRMELQAAWSHFNDRNPKASREALRRAYAADPALEIVPEFFSPDFLRAVDEVRSSVRQTPLPPPAPIDLGELKRISAEKLRDGRVAEVIYDLSNLPAGRLDAEAWLLMAKAHDAMNHPAEAADARRRAGLPAPAPTSPPPSPTPASEPPRLVPSPTAVPAVPTVPAMPLAGNVPVVERPGASAAESLGAGRAALQRGDAFTAQAAANRAIEMEPNSSEGYRLLGDAYLARGEKALAEANWRQSLKLNDRNEATLVSLADFHLSRKNWPGAIESLEKAVHVNPSNVSRLLAVGRHAREEGDLSHAAQVLASVTKLSPGDAAIQTEYAAILVERGDADAAIEPLMQAAAVLPASAIVRGNLAAALRRKGLRREAEREYREALRLEPDYLPALTGLGVILLEAGQPQEAAKLFGRAATLDTRSSDPVIGLARARQASEGLDTAAGVLAGRLDLDDPEVWNEAGAIAFERKRYGEAAAFFEKAVARKPESALFRSNRDRARAAASFEGSLREPGPR